MSASAADGDVRMIAAARSFFSDHRFDGGAADCLRVLSFPGGLERRLFILSRAGMFLSMRVSFALAWGLRFPFLLVFLSSVLSLRPWRSRRRRASGGYVPDACPRSHHLINHLVRRGRSFLSSSCSASSHRCPLFSSGAVIVRRTESVASHQSLRLVLIELGKRRRMGFFAHRHLMSSGFSFLVSSRPSRVASRALFVIVMVARGVVSCGPTRFCLVGERRSVLRLSCGVAACLPSSFAYRLVLLLVVSSRLAVSSLVSFSDALRAVGGACLLVSS